MALSSIETRVSFSGDGISTVFPFPYYFHADADLKVRTVEIATGAESIKVLNSDYTVAGAGFGGGSVTFGSAPLSGFTVIIDRDPSPTQVVSLSSTGPFMAEVLEKAGLNRIVTLIQWLKWSCLRTIRLPNKYLGNFNGEIPTDGLSNVGQALLLSEAEVLLGPTADEIANAQTYAEVASAAQIGAEAAQLIAVGAAEAAEEARDDAIQAKDDAEAAAQSISSNKKADFFVGGGGQKIFVATVSGDPGSIYNSDVEIDGVSQLKDGSAYTVSGNTYTFSEAPPDQSKIQIVTGGAIAVNVPAEGTVSKSKLTVDALYPNCVSKTENGTLLLSEDLILAYATAGDFTLLLPVASGNIGKKFTVRKTDATFNAITINGVGLTTTLNTLNESVTVVSNGSSWLELERRIPSEWFSYLNGDTSDIGSNWDNGNAKHYVIWRRVGDSIDMKFRIDLVGEPPSVDLTLKLPYGLVQNPDFLMSSASYQASITVGSAYCTDINSAANSQSAQILLYNNVLQLQVNEGSTSRVDESIPFTWASGDNVRGYVTGIPIMGWKG